MDEFGLDGEDYLSELPVVLTVTRLPQSMAELPTAVTLIDREMIEASGAVELTDLFRLVAGFQVGHYHGPDGPRTVVTYHGNTNQYSRRMQVLIDGRSVYTWGTGGAEWTDLPVAIDDIERIEVSRGPNGVTYGSNAFLGVINIITYHSSAQQGSHVRLSSDNDQYRDTVLRYGGGKGDFTYRVTGRYQTDDGFDDYTSPGGSFYELNDDTETSSLSFRGDYRAGINDYWTVQAGGAAGLRSVGASYDLLDPVRDRDVVTHYQQVQWKHLLDSESEINVQLYHNLHKVNDQFVTVPLPIESLDVDTSMQAERYNLEISHQFRPLHSLRMVWGGEVRVDEVTAADYFDLGETYQQNLARAFINSEWHPAQRWVINLGDMLEHSDQFGTYHSPRLAINRLVGERGYLRVSSGRAYRNPTAIEDNADFKVRTESGNLVFDAYDHADDIQPERIDSTEFAFGAEGRNSSYEIKIFREKIDSEIDAVRDNAWPYDHWTMMNVGHTINEGVELQLKARTDNVLTSVAYSHVRTTGRRLDELNLAPTEDKWVDVDGAVPVHTVNALLSLRLAERFWASLNYYAASTMFYYAGDPTGGVRIADLSLTRGFKVAGHDAKLQLILKNLLGSYYDFEDETVSERNAYLTLQMDF